MITCVCLNPCIDRTVTVERLLPGGTNRIRAESRCLGGKGINCARVLASQGQQVRVIALLGERDLQGAREDIEGFGAELVAIPVPGALRENLKIFSQESRQITEVNAAGKAVTQEKLDEASEAIVKSALESEWLILTGSLPPDCPAGIYGELIEQVRAYAAPCKVALDAEGEAFRLAVLHKPDLVKPNQHEMALFLGRPVPDDAAMLQGAEALLELGVGAVLASMGAEGSLYASTTERYRASALPVRVVTTVGAGDALLSGFIAARCQGLDAAGAYANALATAAASIAGKLDEHAAYLPAAEQALSALSPSGAKAQAPSKRTIRHKAE